MKIYVSFASDLLTDHQSHGEGLICFSLLNGLAERGHEVFAFSPTVDIQKKSKNLSVFSLDFRMPFDSLNYYLFSFYSNYLFRKLNKKHQFDLVWRMNPFGFQCPIVPKTGGLPLVLGPFYYEWPNRSAITSKRFFISLNKIIMPLANMGFKKTISKASALFSATVPLAQHKGEQYQIKRSYPLPLIIERPTTLPQKSFSSLKLIFVGNFLENKKPLLFCEVVKNLKRSGLSVKAIMCGDGPLFLETKKYVKENNLEEVNLLGRISNEDVMRHLDDSNILINTSYGEPYGRNNIEAMSRGLVVICHNSGGPRDFIENKKTGILVDNLEAGSYSEAIKGEKNNLERISKNAYEYSARWSRENILSELERNLRAVLA